jgi:hypothetical protein
MNVNHDMPVLFEVNNSTVENSSDACNAFANEKVKNRKISKTTTTRSRITKKVVKLRKTTNKIIEANLKNSKSPGESTSSPITQNRRLSDLASSKQHNENCEQAKKSDADKEYNEPMGQLKTKPVAKRLAKLLENINHNDILVNVRCDNKTKHTGSTSTPTIRRRPLKLPLDVSLIANQEQD